MLGVEYQGLFSDHRMLSLNLLRPDISSGGSVEMVPDWEKADMEQIVSNVAAIDWITVLDGKGAIGSWDLVKAVIEQETEKCIPKKRRRTASRPLSEVSS